MLNVNQQSALDATGNLEVVAGPGSGKTRVIVAKIGKLLSESSSTRVCAVTFTRDAAEELPVRVEKEFTGCGFERFSVFGTFHSLAIKQLRDARLLGEIVPPLKQSSFIKQAAKTVSQKDEIVTYEMATLAIESAKCTLNRDDAALAAPVVAEYQKILTRNRMIDLNDVIRDAVLGMRSGTVQPMSVGRTLCTHLLVDEFQDSDEVQYAWIMEHVRRGVITTVVADDDQTIFEWRRALGYKGLLDFEKDANAQKVILGDNYRCHSEILIPADTLIKLNRGNRIEKILTAAKGPGGSLTVIKAQDVEEEAYEVAMRIEPHLEPCDDPSGRFEYTVAEGKWSIIARNHILLNSIESVLLAKKIKYQRAGGGFWKQQFLQIYLDLLRSVQLGQASGIDAALAFCGATSHGLSQLHNYLGSSFSAFLDGELEDLPFEDRNDTALFSKFGIMSKAWRDNLRQGHYPIVIRGVASFIADEALYKAKDIQKRQSLNIAQDILISYGTWPIQGPKGPRAPTLAERVDKVNKQRKKDSDGVALHTMHSCKGLEFDNVGVVGVSEGVIPNPERLDDVNDRRLLYVAFTRAKDHLYITYKVGAISRFISESGLSVPGII